MLGGKILVRERLTDLVLGIRFLLVDRDRPECVSGRRFTNLGDVTGGRSLDLNFVSDARVVL